MKIKRFLGILLALLMCLSICDFSYAKNGEGQVSDIELLNMLGIFQGYEDGNLHPDWSITRMEFAAIIMRIMGYDNGIGQTVTAFSDVPSDKWGSGYVKMAYDLGIVSGYADGTFCPDKKITEAESIKMLVSALGYSYWAEENGGFPQGYISMAVRLGILESGANTTKEATRGYVATSIVNALEADIVHPEEENIAEYEDNILLRLGISVRKGVLTAVYGASVSGDYELEKDEIIVSSEVYKTSITVSRDFVGTSVKIYVRDFGGDDELVVGITGNRKDNSLTIYAEDILDTTTLSNLVYYNSAHKIKNVSLEGNLNISYNGVVVNNSLNYTKERLMPESGYVKLIDMNSNGSYDTAVVKDYKTLVVRSASDRVISDAYGAKIEIDEDTIVNVSMDNQTLSLSDIKPSDVLSAAVSLDGSVVEIIICRDSIDGVVEAYADEDDGRWYTLDNSYEYRLTKAYQKALDEGYSNAEPIKLGNSMKFLLNSFGEIAMGELSQEAERDMLYGYIVQIAEHNGLSGGVEFKILGHENRFIYLVTADNKKILFGRMEDGKYEASKVTSSQIYSYLCSGGSLEKQIISYRLDGDGKIKELYLNDINVGSEYLSKDVPRRSQDISYHTIDGKYYWDEKTVCFYIPRGGSNIAALSSGPCVDYFSGEDSLVMELWDIEEDGYVNCIFCSDTSTGRELDSGSIYYLDYVNSPVMLITKVSHIINDEGIEYKVVEGWQDKKLVRTLVSDTLSGISSDLKPGVVIQYTTNEQQKMFAETIEDDDVMVVYAVLFDCNNYNAEEFMSYDYTGNPYTDSRIQFGYSTVSRLDYPLVRFSQDDCLFEVHSGTAVYVYSHSDKSIRRAATTDIAENSRVFMRTRYSNLREIIIVED